MYKCRFKKGETVLVVALLFEIGGSLTALMLGVYQKHHWNETHAGVVDDYGEIFANIETVRLNDAVLGVSCAAVLLAMRVRAVGVISTSDSNSFDLVHWASKDVQISRGRVERKIHPEQSCLVRLHGAECNRGHHLSRHVPHSGGQRLQEVPVSL